MWRLEEQSKREPGEKHEKSWMEKKYRLNTSRETKRINVVRLEGNTLDTKVEIGIAEFAEFNAALLCGFFKKNLSFVAINTVR